MTDTTIASPTGTVIGKSRSPWGVWWLCGITIGIYYLAWYAKVNRELSQFGSSIVVRPVAAAWCQWVPIAGLVGLMHLGERMATVQTRAAVPATATGGMTLLSCFWYGSQTRYVQRRLNAVWAASAA